MIPSRKVLTEAEKENKRLGHENKGFLSKEFGFTPSTPPLLKLPPQFHIWDEIASEIHKLYKTVRIRKVLERLPFLDPTEENLPDKYLLRAQLLLGIFAHSYFWCEFGHPNHLPRAIFDPWQKICNRLNRSEVTLTISDLFLYNWKFKNPNDTTRTIENLDLLVNVYDRCEEAQFYLTVLDSTIQDIPNVNLIVEAQEAVVAKDDDKIKKCLSLISDNLRAITESFTHISLYKYAEKYCNPIIWGRSTGLFTHPVTSKVMGPGAGGTPYIHALDTFLRRDSYESRIGQEQLRFISRADTEHTKNFLRAIGEISLKEYVVSNGDDEMMGLYSGVIEQFSGNKGFLGVHRRKAYGFLEGAIKAGRVETTGHFSGDVKNIFQDKAWIELNEQFKLAENERHDKIKYEYPNIKRLSVSSELSNKIVTFNTQGTGLNYRPGDYVDLFPENNKALIEKTLKALQAKGDESVELSKSWYSYLLRLSKIQEEQKSLPLREFLKYAHLRPVRKETIEILFKLSQEPAIKDLLTNGLYQEVELWEVLELIRPEHYLIGRILVAPHFHTESISNIIPPLAARTYSVSSPKESHKLELLIQPLKHRGCPVLAHGGDERCGVASSYLTSQPPIEKKVPATALNSLEFKLPKDTTLPVVMFGAGSGLAPFRAFINQAINSQRKSPLYLFISVDKRQSLWFKEELEYWLNSSPLHLFINCTQEDTTFAVEIKDGKKKLGDKKRPKGRIQTLMVEPEISNKLWELMRDKEQGGKGAHIYVCGQTGFGQSVYESLTEIACHHIMKTPEVICKSPKHFIYKLVADFRLMMSIFTSHRDKATVERAIPVSELVLHNNEKEGYWMLINDFIYDVSDFLNIHPGGPLTLINNSGVDATEEYESVGHHLDDGVNAQLDTYLFAKLKPIKFGRQMECTVMNHRLQVVSMEEFYDAWVQNLFSVVSMQNAARNMYDFLSDISKNWGMSQKELLAYSLGAAAENHKVYMQLYLSPLIACLNTLWSLTAPICSPKTDIYFMENSTKAIKENPISIPEVLAQLSQSIDPPPSDQEFDLYHQFQEDLKTHNLHLLAEVKEYFRQGILIFETYGDNASATGGEKLLSYLLQALEALKKYQNNLSSEIKKLNLTSNVYE